MKKIRLKYAIIEFNETLYEVGGKVFRQEEPDDPPRRPGKTSGSKSTEAQRATRQRFREAAAYAKAVLVDPELRARYEQMGRQQGKRCRGAAVADYMSGNDLLSGK